MDALTKFLFENQMTILWAVVVFVIFVVIFMRKGLAPIVKALDAREKQIGDEMQASEDAKKTAEELKAEMEAQLANAEEKISAMFASAKKEADGQKADILAEARTEAERLKDNVQKDIATATAKAIEDVRLEMAGLATAVAGKIIEKELDESANAKLVEDAISQIDSQAV